MIWKPCGAPSRFHKTDMDYGNYDVKQGMHHSLFQWFPYFGTIVTGWQSDNTVDSYAFRSSYDGWMALGYDIRRGGIDYPRLRRACDEWRGINHLRYADDYPLTPWSNAPDRWIG